MGSLILTLLAPTLADPPSLPKNHDNGANYNSAPG